MEPMTDAAARLEGYRRFIGKILEMGEVWGVGDEGMVSYPSQRGGDRHAVLFWSDRALAELARDQHFQEYGVRRIGLFDFLASWLPSMEGDDTVLIGINFTPDLNGFEVRPPDLHEAITDRMDEAQLDAYLAQLRSLIEREESGGEPH
jgi:hypothetical protein